MSDTNDMRRDFEAWHGGIYAGMQKEIAFAAFTAATERAAKVCENKRVGSAHDTDEFQVGYNMGVNDCAVAIRQGGDT